VLPEGEPAGFTRLYWQVRRESWLAVRQILAEFQHRPDDRGADSLLLADAGAGFPWLSHRLAALGYCVVAFDLSGDPDFGLGAARFYEDALGWLSVADNAIVAPGQFLPVLGSLDEPPLAPNRFDAIFCNASLHYVNDLHGCITQLARSLQANGALVIMDSPVAERGQRDDHAGGRILGRQELNQACQVAGLRPEWRSVQRGWLWRRHQLKNWLLRRRRFDFPILIGHKGPGQENERPDAPI
jgi:SAM-dependent methyltransferase